MVIYLITCYVLFVDFSRIFICAVYIWITHGVRFSFRGFAPRNHVGHKSVSFETASKTTLGDLVKMEESSGLRKITLQEAVHKVDLAIDVELQEWYNINLICVSVIPSQGAKRRRRYYLAVLDVCMSVRNKRRRQYHQIVTKFAKKCNNYRVLSLSRS